MLHLVGFTSLLSMMHGTTDIKLRPYYLQCQGQSDISPEDWVVCSSGMFSPTFYAKRW